MTFRIVRHFSRYLVLFSGDFVDVEKALNSVQLYSTKFEEGVALLSTDIPKHDIDQSLRDLGILQDEMLVVPAFLTKECLKQAVAKVREQLGKQIEEILASAPRVGGGAPQRGFR